MVETEGEEVGWPCTFSATFHPHPTYLLSWWLRLPPAKQGKQKLQPASHAPTLALSSPSPGASGEMTSTS